jgi:hypothetical protein
VSSAVEVVVLTDPIEILALAGLTLPEGAAGVWTGRRDVPGYVYAYTVGFTASVEGVDDFMAQLGSRRQGGAPALEGEPSFSLREMVVDSVPAGARLLRGSYQPRTQAGYGNWNVLLAGPDLTEVRVSLALVRT